MPIMLPSLSRNQAARSPLPLLGCWIEHLQEGGLADPELDPYQASRALSGMVSRLAHSTYVLGQKTPLETMVATLTVLWVNALKIPPD